MKKTAVIYARQSFSHEEESTSIAVQLDKCREWCRKNEVEIVGEFQDQGVSSELYPDCEAGRKACEIDAGFQLWKSSQLTKGRALYKAGLGQAFERIEERKPDCLVVYTANRLGRTATGSYLDRFLHGWLMSHRCSIVEALTGSKMDFGDKIMTLFAQMRDALDYIGLAEKRSASLASIHRRIDSHKVVSNAYGVVTTKGVIGFDPEKAVIVRMVYRMVLEGATYPAILKELNDNHLDMAIGRQWYQSNIAHILSNMVYCGMSRDRAGNIARAINIPDPLITYSMWLDVQEVVKTKKSGSQKYNLKGEKRHWLPLSGYLYCQCGRRMQVVMDRGIVYRCVNSGDHVSRIRINRRNEGQDMIRILQSLFVINVVQSRKRLMSHRNLTEEADRIEVEIDGLKRAMQARLALVGDMADADFLKGEFEKSKKQLVSLNNRLAEVREQSLRDCHEVHDAIARDLVDILNCTGNTILPEDTYQRLLQETVDRIIVHDDHITIRLADGNEFSLPRIVLDKRGTKTLPWSLSDIQLVPDSTGDVFDRIAGVRVTFYTIQEKAQANCTAPKHRETLVKTDDYEIVLESPFGSPGA